MLDMKPASQLLRSAPRRAFTPAWCGIASALGERRFARQRIRARHRHSAPACAAAFDAHSRGRSLPVFGGWLGVPLAVARSRRSTSRRRARKRRISARSSVSGSFIGIGSHHLFGCANLRTAKAVQRALPCDSTTNCPISEVFVVPGKEIAYGARSGACDMFGIRTRLRRQQPILQETGKQSVGTLRDEDDVDAFECRQSGLSRILSPVTRFRQDQI
jgi:hypothetical protein